MHLVISCLISTPLVVSVVPIHPSAICQSVRLFSSWPSIIHPSFHTSILSSTHPSICTVIYLSIHLPVDPHVDPSIIQPSFHTSIIYPLHIHPSVHPSTHPSIHPSTCQSACRSIHHPSIIYPSIHLPVYSHVDPSIHLPFNPHVDPSIHPSTFQSTC